jgi:hypothetical protein
MYPQGFLPMVMLHVTLCIRWHLMRAICHTVTHGRCINCARTAVNSVPQLIPCSRTLTFCQEIVGTPSL